MYIHIYYSAKGSVQLGVHVCSTISPHPDPSSLKGVQNNSCLGNSEINTSTCMQRHCDIHIHVISTYTCMYREQI